MRISVDRMRCCGAGMCTLTAPEVFDQDQKVGRVLLLNPTPPPHHAEAAEEAAELCPGQAITISQNGSDGQDDSGH